MVEARDAARQAFPRPVTLDRLRPNRIGAAFEAMLLTRVPALLALQMPEVPLRDMTLLLLDAPVAQPLHLPALMRRRTSPALNPLTGMGARLALTDMPLRLVTSPAVGFHRPRTPFDSLLAYFLVASLARLGHAGALLRPLLPARTGVGASLLLALPDAGLAALGAMPAAPLGLRLLGFLGPFGLLSVAAAALGLSRRSNGERRHGGDQNCSGHGPVPVGGCLFQQSIILAKSA